MPLFSIITICFNAQATIAPTVTSVDAQSFADYEHLIIDGASRDNTLQIISKMSSNPRRIVCSDPDRGIYDAMNKGLRQASGRFVIFLNAGDKFHGNNALQLIADAAYYTPEAQIIYGQTNLVDAQGNYLCPRHLTAPPNLSFKDVARGMLVCHQAFVVDRSIAPQYDLNYRLSADYDWCIRCLKASRYNAFINHVLIDYFADGASTANRRRSLMERFKIMSRYYGLVPTLLRHFGFIGRFFHHQHTLNKSRNH